MSISAAIVCAAISTIASNPQSTLSGFSVAFWVSANSILTCGGVFTGERNRAMRKVAESASLCGKGRNGWIGFAIIFSDGCRKRGEQGTCLSLFLSFVCCYRAIILRRTKTHCRKINSVLDPLSLRPFYQILGFPRKGRKSQNEDEKNDLRRKHHGSKTSHMFRFL